MSAPVADDACVCGCREGSGARAHAIVAALSRDDIDEAIERGLIGTDEFACAHCGDACRTALHVARASRLSALAARERFRARNARLQRRARERDEKRAANAATPATTPVAAPAPALPSAAAAALARARAKAAQRHSS